MTADQLAAALLAERYAAPVPEHRHNEGPTLWWQQHQTGIDEIRRLYHDEQLPTAEVARRVRRPWHEVVGILEGWT